MALTVDMKIIVIAEDELRKLIYEEVGRALMGHINTPFPVFPHPYIDNELPQIWSGTSTAQSPDNQTMMNVEDYKNFLPEEDPNVALATSGAITNWK